ncbi:MAG: hypothetical protein M3R36_18810 [Bacteroidota bacterium]|nr:hypothetical protein [Bacteroidota bacterium]
MSDTNPNNPVNNYSNNPGDNDNESMKYESITAYIDNEIKDEHEKEKILELIHSNPDFHNRYIFESLIKETYRQRLKRIDTPVYVYKKIGQQIDDYIKKASTSNLTSGISPDIYSQQINANKSNLRRNLIFSSIAFILLLLTVFGLKDYLKSNTDFNENDLVSVSRNIFDKVQSGQVNPQYKSSNAKQLADSMNKNLDFIVFIPDVKDAVLVGGVCNEINGEKLAHIIHQRGNVTIYTLQASKNHVMTNSDKITLSDTFKGYINEGRNWFACTKEKSMTAVIWCKDNVICSTVAPMAPQDITGILTNYK